MPILKAVWNVDNNIKNKVFGKIKNIPVIVFIDEHSNSGDPRLFRSNDYNFKGNVNLKNRNEIILSEILDSLNKYDIKRRLIVRLHPKSNEKDYVVLTEAIE